MRVYEFAKKKGVPSKELLELLKKEGIKLSSHMAVLPEGAIPVLEKALKPVAIKPAATSKKPLIKKTTKPVVAKPISKKIVSAKPVSVKPVPVKIPEKKIIKPRAASPAIARPVERVQPKIAQVVARDMPLFEAAEQMRRPIGDLIISLLRRGIACNRNHVLSSELVSLLAHKFGVPVVNPEEKEGLARTKKTATLGENSRWPIVVVMGHVDHGKTTLLDYIRKMNTAAKERGGITQHLSAYEVDSRHGKIVFLDTPGHEAFTCMRERGTRVTDIVVLVVAADDGVMPQTIEVIKQAKEAELPIIVAISKIDKAGDESSIERIKRQLAQHDLLPEDWGGDIICVPLSAKTGKGVEELLEMIVLQSQMMELVADPDSPATGFVLESKLEKGLGPVATVICLNGTIRVGDYFVCGASTGKVRLLIDSFGKRIQEAGPSIPVQVVGFDAFVELGDSLKIVSPQDYAKQRADRNKAQVSVSGSSRVGASISEEKGDEQTTVPLLLKADTQGSLEAALGAIGKINKANKKIPCSFQIILTGVGGISERDIEFASHSGSKVIGMHVKVEKNAMLQAKALGVDVREFGIIYKMTENLDELLKSYEKEVIVLKKVGEATVRKVFPLKGGKVIAGCYVSDGVCSRSNVVVCFRGGEKVGEGKIASLQRDRKTVKQVHAGFECGFITDEFQDWQVDDAVHCFLEEKKKQSEL